MSEAVSEQKSISSDRPVKFKLSLNSVIGWGFTLLYIMMFLLGWWKNEDTGFDAETGIGYILGIIGGSLMLALLIYPVRKRYAFMKRALSVRFWFQLHMVFGLLGPLAILYHSSFGLGSTNSTIALLCMLLVAGSGLIGKYLYVRIHQGLYGSKLLITEFTKDADNRRQRLLNMLPEELKFDEKLDTLEKLALSPAQGMFHAYRLKRTLNKEIRKTRSILRKTLKAEIKTHKRMNKQNARTIVRIVEQFFIVLTKTSQFKIHERLFALWHVAHIPFFIMLIISGIVHVVVVHMY
jgi:hypothetical protein